MLINFLEKHLGKIEYGWNKDENGNISPIQIVKYQNGPFSNTKTYSTLGLSNQDLISSISGKLIHQELIFVAYEDFGDKNIPSILRQVSNIIVENKEALLRGNVIGPYGSLYQNSNLSALYSTNPVYFPDSFKEFYIDDEKTIAMTWLIPIYSEEVKFIHSNGWSKFEDKLVESDPDLINFQRNTII